MFKLEVGKKYVCRNGQVRELMALPKEVYGCIVYKDDGACWWFNLIDRFPVHKVFHHRDSEWDIVAEYVEKKPRKASSPYKKLLTAKNGDVFVLKGERFTVEITGLFGLFLTSLDREHYGPYQWMHVRNMENTAVFERQELIDLLRSGQYVVN